MIEIYINQNKREDIMIVTGGSLEQTSEHATSSNFSIRVPIESDNISECDYIELYDAGDIVFAGTILQKAQQTLTIFPNWRIYDLTIAGNSDLIASVYVDLYFPPGTNIRQILFGNQVGNTDYDANLPAFPGVFSERIAPEDITLGTVDDFSNFVLESAAYLWGKSVKDLLDDLAGIASAWWEITPNRIFNMRFTSNSELAGFDVDNDADVFDLSISKDALTYYSACRVVGGQGASRTVNTIGVVGGWTDPERRGFTTVWQEDTTTLTSQTPLRSVTRIHQTENGGAPTAADTPEYIQVGYTGLHDNDPDYQALMTSGSNEITLKEGYNFVTLVPNSPSYAITLENVVFEVDVYARIVDPELCQEISEQRGGSGIIEYTLEDDSIRDFGTAVMTAQTFLNTHAQKAVEISFSTFSPCRVGQILTVDLPYYNVFGNYRITSVVATTVLDKEDQAIFQYAVTASNVDYRDPYKELWYSPVTTFSLDGEQPAEDGIYLPNTLQCKTYITAYASTPTTWEDIESKAYTWTLFQQLYPSWNMLQSATNPYEWQALQRRFPSWSAWEATVISWAWLEQIERGWYYLGNYLTPYGRRQFTSFLSGNPPQTNTNFFGAIFLSSASGRLDKFEPQDVSMLENGGVSTFSLLPTDAEYQISKIMITEGNSEQGEPLLSADVNIDHSRYGPRGEYSLTIAIRTTIE